MTTNTELRNGTIQPMKFGTKYCVGDVLERWLIDGEGGNSTVQYSAFCATREAAKQALIDGDFPLCPIGDGGAHIGQSRVTFSVTHPRPYHLVGERLTVTGVSQFGGAIQSYTCESLEVVRIVEGQLTDRSGCVLVD